MLSLRLIKILRFYTVIRGRILESLRKVTKMIILDSRKYDVLVCTNPVMGVELRRRERGMREVRSM